VKVEMGEGKKGGDLNTGWLLKKPTHWLRRIYLYILMVEAWWTRVDPRQDFSASSLSFNIWTVTSGLETPTAI
jgi:hypothetical protein